MQINKYDVERLARGERISHESFLAIMSCPAALVQLSRLRQFHQAFNDESADYPALDHLQKDLPTRASQAADETSVESLSAAPNSAAKRAKKAESRSDAAARADVPKMDVSFEELAIYSEHGPLSPERLEAVERFLQANYPEALVERAVAGERRARDAAATQSERSKHAGLESDSAARDKQTPRSANESHPDHRRPPERSRSPRVRHRLRGDSEAG